MKRSVRKWVFGAALLVGLTSCAPYTTVDVYRPLIVDRVPAAEDEIGFFVEVYPERDEDGVRRSLKLTRKAWDYFGIQKYDRRLSYLSLERLQRALELFPENPFAWVQLGSYLALQHQPLAAANATTRALEELERKEFGPGASLILGDLQQTGQINLALYYGLAQRFDEALQAVEQVPKEDLDAFRSLAVVWARSIALIGLGRGEDASEYLLSAEQWIEGLVGKPGWIVRRDYPQYFVDRRRGAVFAFLRGQALLVSGQPAIGAEELEKSVELDPRLWDARFALGSAYYAQGDLNSALAIVQGLREELPGGMIYREEVVHFNLGNILAELGDTEEAEESFREAIEVVERRRKLLDSRVRDALPGELDAELLEDDPLSRAIVAEAQNNLGTIELTKALESKGGERRERAEEAREYFQAALEEGTYQGVAWANIARVLWIEGDYEGFLQASQSGLNASEGQEFVLDTLLDLSLRSSDPAITYRGVVQYLDTVEATEWLLGRPDVQDSLDSLVLATNVILAPSKADEINQRVERLAKPP